MTTIAIVGAGYMGRTHAESWSNLGLGEDIKYVCSPRSGRPLEHAPRAQAVSDLEVVLQDPDVDVLSVCTPTPSHRAIAVAALRSGKNVLLEKPIALTVDDALAIQHEAERSGTVLMLAQVVRFFEGYRLLRNDVADGKLGTVLSARAHRYINRPDWAPWWHDEAQSGGVLVDFAIHDFDQMNLFLGEPVSVTASATHDLGPVETTIRYRDGGVGQVLSFADLHPDAPFTSGIGILGTLGMADYEFSAGSPTDAASGDGDRSAGSRYRIAGTNDAGVEDLPAEDPYTRQIEYFLRCVTTGTPPKLSPASSAIRALEVSLAARSSLQTGASVEIESVVADPSLLVGAAAGVRQGASVHPHDRSDQ